MQLDASPSWLALGLTPGLAARFSARGRAIDVLGPGIHVCYPMESKKLGERVLERGAISEFPLRTHSRRKIFRCKTVS
jgi:predicted Rossmann fold nucleotide-binding protein DprA/Smf involved in DNA uptake